MWKILDPPLRVTSVLKVLGFMFKKLRLKILAAAGRDNQGWTRKELLFFWIMDMRIGSSTLHGNGTRTGTGHGTTGNNESWFLSLSQTSVNISVTHICTHCSLFHSHPSRFQAHTIVRSIWSLSGGAGLRYGWDSVVPRASLRIGLRCRVISQ